MATARECPLGYVYNAALNACYSYKKNDEMTFTEARQVCRSEGADMVSIRDRTEDAFVSCKTSF